MLRRFDVADEAGCAMGKKTKRADVQKVTPTARAARKRHVSAYLLALAFATAAVAGVFVLLQLRSEDVPPRASALPRPDRKFALLAELLAASPEELADADIAEMNLLCASGLPGAENLDIDHCLATLDRWAAAVKSETERHLYRLTDPRYAEHYRHSEAYLRAELLLQVLQEDLGVRYDMTALDNFAFNDSRVAFLHGMIPAAGQTVSDTLGGTCASMPVMYVAVGRRLGYPLKLVPTKGHLFVRWEGKNHPNPAWRERFNIEGTGGFGSFEDDYYKNWPFKLTQREVRVGRYLISMSPAEELAAFLASRGHCLLDNGRTEEALGIYAAAHRLAPEDPAYVAWMRQAQERLRPPAFVNQRTYRQPPTVYRNDPLSDVRRINAINRANTRLREGYGGQVRRMHTPMPGVPQTPMPLRPNAGQPQPYRRRCPDNRRGRKDEVDTTIATSRE